ncbi:ATP-dependent RNA helicase, partial [mine drainage metagenome]
VRGDTAIVNEDHRSIELTDMFAIGDRSSGRVELLPTFVDGKPNRRAIDLDALLRRHAQHARGSRPRPLATPRPDHRRTTLTYRPRRAEMVERLEKASLLPAIYFVFSRSGCDDAVRHSLDDGLRLTTAAERNQIREIAETHVEALSDDDLAVLGYGRFVAA